MAKKNSSKTATEKAIQSSEPRVINYRGWKGVNFADTQLTWNPLETGPDKFRQTDLPANFLLVQNNLITTDMLGLETRQDSTVIGRLSASDIAAGYKFTGISCVYHHWLFAVVKQKSGNDYTDCIYFRSLLSDDEEKDDWTPIVLSDPNGSITNSVIYEIGFYESKMVATAKVPSANKGRLFLAHADIDSAGTVLYINGINDGTANQIDAAQEIPDYIPGTNPPAKWSAPSLTGKGDLDAGDETETGDNPRDIRVEVCYTYTNRLGTTIGSNVATTYVNQPIYTWSSSRYLEVSGTFPSGYSGIAGVDVYCRDTENTDWVFQGHVNRGSGATTWTYSWLGNMTDISQWTNSPLTLPSENTTVGVNATHFSTHDSRMYYWGVPEKPYRLYIGGNPGSEFTVARGLGGAWIDIEPGSGFEIKGTAKWKTTSGANIVTIMCGNRNTNKVKRFNLVETNITVTNEISYKGYMYEEVSNVVGCNSRYGYGVFGDGLYSLSRFGLMLTTMAMEYNSQMKNQSVSDAIQPIFTERLGAYLRDTRMVCIDNVIYIALSEDTTRTEPINLDNVILCYDMDTQAWYTWTHDEVYGQGIGQDPDKIHQIFAVDSDEFQEGLGAITDTQIRLYPVTGVQEPTVPDFQVIMETGELIPRMPMQAFSWIEQFEFRFDYLISDPLDPPTILIEGVDYYGRQFSIVKQINKPSRKSAGYGETGELRNHVEWVRVGKMCESLRIRIKGRSRFRLTHINCKMYQQADTIGTPYGYDASDSYRNRHSGDTRIHHYINDYNNLRRAVIA